MTIPLVTTLYHNAYRMFPSSRGSFCSLAKSILSLAAECTAPRSRYHEVLRKATSTIAPIASFQKVDPLEFLSLIKKTYHEFSWTSFTQSDSLKQLVLRVIGVARAWTEQRAEALSLLSFVDVSWKACATKAKTESAYVKVVSAFIDLTRLFTSSTQEGGAPRLLVDTRSLVTLVLAGAELKVGGLDKINAVWKSALGLFAVGCSLVISSYKTSDGRR